MSPVSRSSIKRAASRRAAELGVEITDSQASARLLADAPLRQVFGTTLTHCVVADYNFDSKAEAWASLLEDMEFGLEPCEEEDCDTCRERAERES